jgi:hypothetical protein
MSETEDDRGIAEPPSAAEITSVRSKLWDGDFRPVALCSWDNQGFERTQRGKVPIGKDWPERARQNPPECVRFHPVPHALSTGILCDGLRAFDIDIDDPDLAGHCRAVILDRLGDAPRRYRDNSGRCLIALRAAAGAPGKITLAGTKGKIEVLGKGQQFQAHGLHYSGTQLLWFPDAPWTIARDSLPAVTEAQVHAVLTELAPLIEATPPQQRSEQDHAPGEPQADPLRIAVALQAIANNGATDWEFWNRIGMATWRATGGTNLGFEAFDHWSKRNASYNASATRARWDHYRDSPPDQIGAGTLFLMAAEARKTAPPPEWEEQHPPADDGYQVSQDEHARGERPKRRKGPPPAPSAAELPTIWDPWEEPPPAAWPGGILSPEAEDTLAAVSLRDGMDLGLLCTTVLAGASAAASKASRFTPYHDSPWSQPPIWWLMVIGESGVRKTYLDTIAMSAIREARTDLWRIHKAQMREWEDTPKKERGEKPQEPPALLCTDATPEGLRDALAANHRGTALVADELVVLLDFGRYSNRKEGGMAARGLFLSGYEDQPYEVRRANKPAVYLDHTGFSVFGGIQPKRLASLKLDWETDGVLQRLCGVRAAPANATQPGINVGNGMVELHKAIKRLCFHDARNYTTTHDGSTIIRDTETVAAEYALLTDYGDGWPGFCRKLHGTEARLTLVLHLLEDPTEPIIPTERVSRAHRLIHGYVLQHATDFHGSMGGSRSLRQDVAGWLLTRGDADPNPTEMERITASDLTSNVRACRDVPSKQIGDVLDRFITGGWLSPETDFPNNRGWYFNPAIRCRFAERAVAERSRRADARAAIQRINAQRKNPTS